MKTKIEGNALAPPGGGPAKEVVKVVETVFIPVISSATPSGKLKQRQLKAREMYESADQDLDAALAAEPVGTVGEVKRFKVVAEKVLRKEAEK